jgi:hypothetical protein
LQTGNCGKLLKVTTENLHFLGKNKRGLMQIIEEILIKLELKILNLLKISRMNMKKLIDSKNKGTIRKFRKELISF